MGFIPARQLLGRARGLFVATVLVIATAPTAGPASYVTLIAPTGEDASDYFGGSVACAGDVNGDGFDDLIVGARANGAGGTQAGRAYVYLGGYSFDDIPDIIFTGHTQCFLGNCVAGAGDMNGDGYDDIIVGAYADDTVGNNAGRAYLYWGGAAMDSVADLVLSAEAAGDFFGCCVASAGDFNGDGHADVIVGAYDNDTGGDRAGRAYVFFGGVSPDSMPDAIFTGQQAGDLFGYTVATAGDVNGDDFDDVIVGAVEALNDVGVAYVYFGGDPPDNIADLVLQGEAVNDLFGVSLATAGDVNQDGFADFLVGATGNDTNGNNAGRAYVFLGGQNPDPFPDRTLSGLDQYDSFGGAVSSAGDIDGDGNSDIAVGARYAGPGDQNGPGAVSIFHGGSYGDEPDNVISVGAIGDVFGISVAGGVDFDGDGRPDLIVGAEENDLAGNSAGRAYALTPIPLAVLSPNGGETWVSGTWESIDWTGGNLVDLHLSLDGGFSWTAVATEVGGGIQNSFPYIVPATPTNYARVAVAPAGVSPIHSSADQSDSLFTIILPTGIDVLASTETNLLLSSPWPNPRIGPGGSTFHITLPSSETLQLALYDVRGRLVASRAPETFAVGGTHAVQWDPGSVSSGTYYVRLSTASGHSAGTTWVLVR